MGFWKLRRLVLNVAKEKTEKKDKKGQNNIVHVFDENVAGRKQATFSRKHGLCPFRFYVSGFRVQVWAGFKL